MEKLIALIADVYKGLIPLGLLSMEFMQDVIKLSAIIILLLFLLETLRLFVMKPEKK